ncbi:MAG TPA: alpha/beta fold hydrolase, partial [Ornithinibacter sp.]|nr:alpha/beta fold hydrolase [Ornithinibacter sp.]
MGERRPVDLGPLVLSVVERSPASPVARPVVLLHGTGHTARSWDAVAASLSATRTVLAVDLRGHGDSGWPGEYSITL